MRSCSRHARKLWALLCFGAVSSALQAHPGLHHDIERVSEAIEREPGRADLYLERAFLERLDAQPDAALADLGTARGIEPANRGVAAERGMTLSALGRDREAEQELTRFLSTGPGTAPTFAERAKVRERLGKSLPAVADYSASIALRPEVETYLARGALLESLGKSAEAHDGYLDGTRLLAGEPNLRLALLRLDVRTKRFDEALGLVDEQLARADVKTDWYLRRGEILDAAGRQADAREDRQRALVESERAIALNATGVRLVSRAKVRLALGQDEEARRDLVLALAKSPRYAEAQLLLARLDERGGSGGRP